MTRWIGALIAMVVSLALLGLAWWGLLLKTGEFSEAGDAFAPISAVLSFFALSAAVLSVFMQKEELRLQRIEMAETREVLRAQSAELARTAEVQEAQQRALVASARATEAQVLLMRMEPVERFLAQASGVHTTLQTIQASVSAFTSDPGTAIKGDHLAPAIELGLRRVVPLECPQSIPPDLRTRALVIQRMLDVVIMEYQVLYGRFQGGTWPVATIKQFLETPGSVLKEVPEQLESVAEEMREWARQSADVT